MINNRPPGCLIFLVDRLESGWIKVDLAVVLLVLPRLERLVKSLLELVLSDDSIPLKLLRERVI